MRAAPREAAASAVSLPTPVEQPVMAIVAPAKAASGMPAITGSKCLLSTSGTIADCDEPISSKPLASSAAVRSAREVQYHPYTLIFKVDRNPAACAAVDWP